MIEWQVSAGIFTIKKDEKHMYLSIKRHIKMAETLITPEDLYALMQTAHEALNYERQHRNDVPNL